MPKIIVLVMIMTMTVGFLGTISARYVDPAGEAAMREDTRIKSRLTSSCASECMKGSGSYSSQKVSICRRAHDQVEEGMSTWNGAMLQKSKGNFMSAGFESKKARKLLNRNRKYCPETVREFEKKIIERPPVMFMTMDENINYYGLDYRHIPGLTPSQCRETCRNESLCKAYTWVKPGVQGEQSFCWLKDRIPKRSNDSNCISGEKAFYYY